MARVEGAGGTAGEVDDDGVANGIENVLGTDPSAPTQGLRETSNSGGTFKFRHSRTNQIASDVTTSYEWSVDLATWHASGETNGTGVSANIASSTITDNSHPVPDEIEVSATVTAGSAARLFVRIAAVNH